jgi:hypothetical protein
MEGDRLGDLCADGSTILKRVGTTGFESVNWSHLVKNTGHQMRCSFKQRKKASVYHKMRKISCYINNYY